MAEIEFGAVDDRPDGVRGALFAGLVNWSGGLISMALIAGLAVWGYQLLVRDVTGVPVIRALEGPMRVAPEEPGGLRTAHQGLSVNEIAGTGGASEPAERIVLAPPVPDLAEEDAAPAAAVTEPSQMAAADTPQGPPAGIEDIPEDALATDAAVAEALSGGLGAPSGDADPVLALRDDRGLIRSPRPMRRPSGVATRPFTPSGAPAPTVEIEAASLPIGTRLVQLGAFETADMARDQWDRIGARFDDYFVGKRRVVQQAEAGGTPFYRLRAEGFTDLGDARRFCSALAAAGADCIPVEMR